MPIVALMLANPFELVLLFAVTIGCFRLNCLFERGPVMGAAVQTVLIYDWKCCLELKVCRSVPAFGSRPVVVGTAIRGRRVVGLV